MRLRYKILVALSIIELENQVNDHIKMGGSVVGGVAVFEGRFYQAITM